MDDVDFPVDRLSATAARIWRQESDGSISIEIDLDPIELSLGEDELSGRLDSPIRLDLVGVPTSNPEELAGRTFDFPVNPEEGYIDGSVYVLVCHVPVDVTRMVFTKLEGKETAITIEAEFRPEFEGLGYRNFRKVLSCPIRQETPA